MGLESYVREKLKTKDILLMTHIVLGYPSFEHNLRIIRTMVEAGVDLMELQVPFSEPIADGPVIARAGHSALEAGVTTRDCLEFVQKVVDAVDLPFLIMTYYNIPFTFGVKRFVSLGAEIGLNGMIIPDLPPEEGLEYLELMREHDLAPIQLFSPTTSLERMQYLASFARGFIYCVARKGVTGRQTHFSQQMTSYLRQCRRTTPLPLAVGFGIKEKRDVDFLKGKTDIAVIGTHTLRIMEEESVQSVAQFIRSLC
ncbi:MAG: tryptophan synthase subunit alpha [Desulfatiglandaceae bacterium]